MDKLSWSNKIQTNCKGLKTTVCLISWRQIMDNKIQNEPKKFRLPLLKSWEQKKRVLGAKAGCCACPLHTSPKRWADHLSYPSSPTLRHIPVVVVQLLSRIQLFASPWTTACQAPLSTAISWSLLSFMSIESVTLSNHLILCPSLLLLPSIFPSIRVFSSELAFHIRWPKYWSFSFIISPANEYSG